MSVNQPIKPSEVSDAKLEHTPVQIIQAFNEMITKNYSGGSARVLQNQVLDLALSKYSDRLRPDRNQLLAWLNIEEVYRDAGWIVEYHSPDYTESFPPYFIFKKTKPVWRS